jgi:hypothetical protein
MLHFAMTSVASEMFVRFWVQYLRYPWVLVRLVDPRLPSAERQALAEAFCQAKPCCLDRGFGSILHPRVCYAEDMLEGGALWGLIQTMSMQKVMNIEVEDNFSRAARNRATTQGVFPAFVEKSWH